MILKECYAKKGYDFEILKNGFGFWRRLPVQLLECEACGESFYVQQGRRRAGKDLPRASLKSVRASCREEHREELDMLYFDGADEKSTAPSVVSSGEAYKRAQADPEWKKARSDWWDCQRQEGLTPLHRGR